MEGVEVASSQHECTKLLKTFERYAIGPFFSYQFSAEKTIGNPQFLPIFNL